MTARIAKKRVKMSFFMCILTSDNNTTKTKANVHSIVNEG